jgi:carbon-monoxide dehydrogenase medium subunit
MMSSSMAATRSPDGKNHLLCWRRRRSVVKMAKFVYHRPEDVEEALEILAEHGSDGKVLAGGQSLLPLLAMRLAAPGHLVDVGHLPDADSIDVESDGTVVVGGTVRHVEIEQSATIAAVAPLLSGAAPLIGHRAIRSRGTVCGSLAHADPAAELPAVALALDAELVVRGPAGERRVAAADFFVGYLTTALAEDELLVAVRLPPWAPPDRRAKGWSIQEVSRRQGDFAMVGVAVVVEGDHDGMIRRAALSYFGAASTAVRVIDAERVLVGRRPTLEALAEAATIAAGALNPPADDHGSAAYRRHLAAVLTRRALTEASVRAGLAA